MSDINTLDQLAREINVRLAKASEIDQRAEVKIAVERRQASDHRLADALRFREARGIVTPTALAARFGRRGVENTSRRHPQKSSWLWKIAKSPEPAAAFDANRTGARNGMRRLRNKRREGSNMDPVRATPSDERAKAGTSDPLDPGDFDRLRASLGEY